MHEGIAKRGILARLCLHVAAHAAATAASVGTCCALAIASYVVLFAVAAVLGQGPGGPLALPFLVASAALVGLVLSITCSWPACVLARALRAARDLHWAWELPLACVFAFAASTVLALLARAQLPHPPSVVPVLGVAALVALPLLCVHWASARIAESALDALARFAGADGDSQDDLPV